MTVVVGYSGRPEGRASITRGLAEARLRKTNLIVVPNTAADDVEPVRAELASGGVNFEIAEPGPDGQMADHLLEIADANDTDCIVIGLRRRSPTGKLLLGTNAQRVLLDASCAVLAVKAEDD